MKLYKKESYNDRPSVHFCDGILPHDHAFGILSHVSKSTKHTILFFMF